MHEWKRILVHEEATLLHTMQVINDNKSQFAVVIDNKNQLRGTVTDGDIRRGILRGDGLEVPIKLVMNANPTFATEHLSLSTYKTIIKEKKLKQLPVVNSNKQIVNILFAEQLEQEGYDNKVVLMLGGLGSRLRPLTEDIPKPMLRVGSRPIVETIINNFKQYGFRNFIFSVNYKKEVIQDYFGDGSAFGITIEYVEEDKKMGTAGALSLLKNKPEHPFFVMNGDLLTQINFEQLMEFHIANKSVATMCVREFEYEIPYGVIETSGIHLRGIKEKPIHRSFINAGIYVLSPETLCYLPPHEYYDMPSLFDELIASQKQTTVFPIYENWLDIGRIEDFHKANIEMLKMENAK